MNTRIAIALVLFTTLLTVGCQPAVYMMPTPAAISSGSIDPFAKTPEQERSSDIRVGYATTRIPSGTKRARIYTRSFDADLRMGTVTVQIGNGDLSWKEIQDRSLHNARGERALLSLSQVDESGTLYADEPLDSISPELRRMMADLNSYIDRSPLQDITIYVHGANNNFYRSAAQAAQYRHFTGRQAIVVLFSWPSAESIIRYGTDIRNIRETVPTFARFIRFVAKYSSARKINILAYSAGATLATEALAILGEDTSHPDRQAYKDSLRIGEVYFAAPDTDFDDWVDEYRSYRDIVDNVTVTINPHDAVLAIAQEDRHWKAYGGWEDVIKGATSKSRLGRPDIDDISKQDALWLIEQSKTGNLDIIDIDPATIPGLGKGAHDFWYNSPWVSTDALLDLNLHARPAERGLAKRTGERDARIWYFPPDYEQRIKKAIDELAEKYRHSGAQSK